MRAEKIAALRASLAKPGLEEISRRIPLGHGAADLCLKGGLERGVLHEVFAAISHEAAATGFAAGLAARVAARKRLLWIRQDFSALEFGALSATGLLEFGIDPARLLLLCVADAADALRAANDALSCAALGAVVIEIPGKPKILDLMASRRLTLACAKPSPPFSCAARTPVQRKRWLVPRPAGENGAIRFSKQVSSATGMGGQGSGSWSGVVIMVSSRKRIVALWFPRLATDRLQRRGKLRPSETVHEAPPLVVVAKVDNALRLSAVDRKATSLGLAIGQPLANARAMLPALKVVAANEPDDLKLLTRIADWCDCFTPYVALDGPRGLLLDVTGATHLFGGEQALLNRIRESLRAQGFAVRGAMAGTQSRAPSPVTAMELS
jgi:hypothetical protein